MSLINEVLFDDRQGRYVHVLKRTSKLFYSCEAIDNDVLDDDLMTDWEKRDEIYNVVFTRDDLQRMEPYNSDWFTLIGIARDIREVAI